MSMFGDGLPGGAHSDVLGAQPTDDTSKSNLVDELKVIATFTHRRPISIPYLSPSVGTNARFVQYFI